ncbi:hypothetical protein [Clostridium chauvoei]|uniref:Uncharacterized protein n=2 Tax=Clostridium chauvoei TaxID=46867 RepID=S6F0L3_9CLOT|nr:hypothetical protein [Clostridium chauvoei]ATD55423.1 hypothetical protein BTM20_09305 [Clostridium chauvoei]ATD56905.1 hypothetical protein BTM21_03735 [Clostridium chauvoei]MBX7280745.1 hypothetical protein [Clostridium chauvoei]MBX7283228.1 hypothetical protein [Clostridium chauvoei]MBX7285887.1 hypothetical protein [Clostridium chauvoei]
MLSKEVIEFFKKSRELIDHSHSMEMATNYKKDKFNYALYGILLQQALKEIGNEDEFKQVYSNGIY